MKESNKIHKQKNLLQMKQWWTQEWKRKKLVSTEKFQKLLQPQSENRRQRRRNSKRVKGKKWLLESALVTNLLPLRSQFIPEYLLCPRGLDSWKISPPWVWCYALPVGGARGPLREKGGFSWLYLFFPAPAAESACRACGWGHLVVSCPSHASRVDSPSATTDPS